MKSKEMVLRCFAERDGDVWIAYCAELSLAVEGDSLAEVLEALDAQVRAHMVEALGEDDSPLPEDRQRWVPLRAKRRPPDS